MTTELDMILLVVFGTIASIFGLLFLMAALEPPKATPQAATGRRATGPAGASAGGTSPR